MMMGVFNILKSVSIIALSSIIFFLVITSNDEQKAWSQLVLDLRPLPPFIEEGQVLEFSGSITLEGQPFSGLTIVIKDATTGQVIGPTVSDSNGEFHSNWIAIYQNEPYAFFAELSVTGAAPARSETYKVTVTPVVSEETGATTETSETRSEFDGEANYINPELFLLIIVLVGAAAAYVIYKSRRHTARPVIEIRGGLD